MRELLDQKIKDIMQAYGEAICNRVSSEGIDHEPVIEFSRPYFNEFKKVIMEAGREEMIEACKYGYDYHRTTQFPELCFEDQCRQNYLQVLESKNHED